MIDAFSNITKIPELKKRVYFTLALLVVYRIGVHIPTPGIDAEALSNFFKQSQGTLLSFFDMFSGGALERLSVFALGIMPYISSSIILQLLTVVWPYLENLSKEPEGRKKITQYTRYGTVILSFFQGFMIAYGLENGMAGPGVVINPGWSFRLMTMTSLTAGTAFIMWLGEQITEYGIGNGISLIIFAGIVARMPSAALKTIQLVSLGEMNLFIAILITILMILIVGIIIWVERGQRRIPIQHAKRIVGRKVYGGASTHLPLRINTAGVIPPIFASSILMFPSTIANFIPESSIAKMITHWMTPGHLISPYTLLYVILIIFFCYFYTAVTFNPIDVADNLKKQGGYIPGIRPGKKTADYIDKVLTRITFGGAVYVALICVLPTVLISQGKVPFYFGGTALLIVVGVALDTIQQLEAHMLTRHYEGFLGAGMKFKGRGVSRRR